nr:HAMP domain-containing sensor histidine kinase [Streptomyces sp. SID3343]
MAGRVLRPVHAVSGAARRLSRHELHRRIPVAGPHDEMRELAETFNAMLARLERAFAAQHRFAANASHELRGPITTMRTLVDVAADVAAADVAADVAASATGPGVRDELPRLVNDLRGQLDRQQRLVDGLLDLAQSENGATTIGPVRLDELAGDALARAAAAIDERGISVYRSLEPTLVQGDPVLLELLVDNLIRNAVDHNRGGLLRVTGSPGRLVVENSGAEITPARLTELREPFRRGHRDRLHGGGTGLGLAIADAVAAGHDATLTMTPRSGGGVRAEFTLPPTTGP